MEFSKNLPRVNELIYISQKIMHQIIGISIGSLRRALATVGVGSTPLRASDSKVSSKYIRYKSELYNLQPATLRHHAGAYIIPSYNISLHYR
jgi:hypothetical protein